MNQGRICTIAVAMGSLAARNANRILSSASMKQSKLPASESGLDGRSGPRLGYALIVATAAVNNLAIVTRSARDFEDPVPRSHRSVEPAPSAM